MSKQEIPFDGPKDVPFAIMLFNLRNAESPSDAAIERLVQETLKFIVHRAEKRDLSFEDAICVTQEVVARLLVSGFIGGNGRSRAAEEKLITDMMAVCTRRAIGLLDGASPSDDLAAPN